MGGTCLCGRRTGREDQNGLKPNGGSEIGTSLGAGHYPRTNEYSVGDCYTAADLYSTANRTTKANLYFPATLAHIYSGTYSFTDADRHPDTNSYAQARSAYAHTNTDAGADAHDDSQVSAIHQRNSRTTLK